MAQRADRGDPVGRRLVRDTAGRRTTVDEPRRAVGPPPRQPPVDRALGDAGGLGRRRPPPPVAHDAVDHSLAPDRTERCPSVNLHLGLLGTERAWQLLSLQRGPDIY